MKQQLIHQVEQMTGRRCRVASDFVNLSKCIEHRTRERLSSSTLRRL